MHASNEKCFPSRPTHFVPSGNSGAEDRVVASPEGAQAPGRRMQPSVAAGASRASQKATLSELTSVWIWVLEFPHFVFDLLEHGCNPSRVPDVPVLLEEDADLDGLRQAWEAAVAERSSRLMISALIYGHRCHDMPLPASPP